MSPSIWQILIVLALGLLLFGGRGRISGMLEDLGKGISGFRRGLSDEAKNAEAAQEAQKVADQTSNKDGA